MKSQTEIKFGSAVVSGLVATVFFWGCLTFSATTPVITNIGLGGHDWKAIWITGQGFTKRGQTITTTCQVNIYSKNWTLLRHISNIPERKTSDHAHVNCQDNLVTLVIPKDIFENHTFLHITVVNPDLLWAQPRGVRTGFEAPNSDISFNTYYQYKNAVHPQIHFGTLEPSSIFRFGTYGPIPRMPYPRHIRFHSVYGQTGYNEAAEFVEDGLFLYNTGLYQQSGRGDNLYYPNDMTTDAFTRFVTHQALIVTPDGTFNITHLLNPDLGEPYALLRVPNYPYQIKYVGYFYSSKTGAYMGHFNHVNNWSLPHMTYNSAYRGSNKYHEALRQTEYWSHTNVNGGGSIVYQASTYAKYAGVWQFFPNPSQPLPSAQTLFFSR